MKKRVLVTLIVTFGLIVLLAGVAMAAPATPHAVDGMYSNCMMCHSAIKDSHDAMLGAGAYDNCVMCHAQAGAEPAPAPEPEPAPEPAPAPAPAPEPEPAPEPAPAPAPAEEAPELPRTSGMEYYVAMGILATLAGVGLKRRFK